MKKHKDLELENAKLKQTIKKLSKRSNTSKRLADVELALAEELLEEEMKDKLTVKANVCPGCGKDSLEVIPLGVKKLLVCDVCRYRKIKK